MPNLGIAEDPRTIDKKQLDFHHQELAGAIPISWVEKTNWKKYSIRNQDGSYSCVAQSAAKALEVKTGIVQSAHPIYRNRLNYPSQGMWLQNMGSIVVKQGTASEQADPSQKMNEDQMNADVKVPSTIKSGMYIMVDPNNINAIAEAIEVSGACPLIFNAFMSEWTDIPKYNGKNNGMDLQHCVTAIDYFNYQGKKCILVEDSWGKITGIGNNAQRVITEDFLKARCCGAMYFLNIVPTDLKPHYNFKNVLTYGMENKDVEMLQEVLAYEGLFPARMNTGFFGNITASAVLKWQINHSVASLEELQALQGRRVGPKTIYKLNEMYN